MATRTYKTIVVEDEPRDLDLFLNLLKPFSNIEVIQTAEDIENAIAAISFHRPDLIFLDIDLYGRNSFEVLDIIEKYDLNPILIFTTAHSKYMKEVFKYSAFEFMLKPIDPDDLKDVINRLERDFKQQNFKQSYEKLKKTFGKLVFNTTDGFTVINPKDIIYIEADGAYSEILLANEKKKTITKKLGEIEKMLSSDLFFRVHKSYIVNLSKIDNANRQKGKCFFQSQNEEISIKMSRETIKKLKDRLEEFY